MTIGKLVVKTAIDNSDFEKKIGEQKKELTKYEKEAEELLKLKSQYESDISAFEKEQEQIKKTREEYDKLKQKIKEIETERSRISTLPENQMKQAYAENPELSTGYFELLHQRKELNKQLLGSTLKNNEEIEKEKKLLNDVNGKLKANLESQKAIGQNIENIQGKIFQNNIIKDIETTTNNIGKSISNIIKKASRWTLAIFGIRGAYMAVRNAINVISQDDEQLKADIDYMKNALAYTLEPVVRKIVEVAKQLLFYIGYLIKAWTGKNIFENANKSLKKSVGSAKELKKQLSGFDEMNILSDSSSSTGGTASPSFNFNEIENMKEPKWLIKIKEIGQWIIDNWQDVIFGLLLIKLFINLVTGNWIGVVIDFIGLLVVAFFKLRDAFKVIIESHKEIWTMFVNWLKTKIIPPIVEFFTNMWQKIKDGFSLAINSIKDKFTSIKDFFKNIITTIIGLFKNIGTSVGNVVGSAFKNVINSVLKAIENILNFPIRSINSLIKTINKVPGINLGTLNTFSLPRLAKGGIINQPGRGIPVGSAYAGERGAEGVIPLTDSQQMALLGEAIGRYVTINATIPVYAYNRQVDRQIKRIKAEDNFAFNK